MSILDNLKRFVQPYSDEDDYEEFDDEEMDDEDQAEVSEPAPRTRRPSPFATAASATREAPAPAAAPAAASTEGFQGRIMNMESNTGKQDVVLFHAKSFESAAKAVDELRKRKAVILNMEGVDKALTRRVVDFLSGAIYALEGDVKKVAQSTYLFCPQNMNVVGDLENVPTEIESYI